MLKELQNFYRDFPIVYRLYAKKMLVKGFSFQVPLMILLVIFKDSMETDWSFLFLLFALLNLMMFWMMFSYYLAEGKGYVETIKRSMGKENE